MRKMKSSKCLEQLSVLTDICHFATVFCTLTIGNSVEKWQVLLRNVPKPNLKLIFQMHHNKLKKFNKVLERSGQNPSTKHSLLQTKKNLVDYFDGSHLQTCFQSLGLLRYDLRSLLTSSMSTSSDAKISLKPETTSFNVTSVDRFMLVALLTTKETKSKAI